ncbi:hypothetical protein GCM10025873_16490 [Demequina sediminis]|nr:hypothetical protein GCM10025873_16490 [Demequina sediminis]
MRVVRWTMRVPFGSGVRIDAGVVGATGKGGRDNHGRAGHGVRDHAYIEVEDRADELRGEDLRGGPDAAILPSDIATTWVA